MSTKADGSTGVIGEGSNPFGDDPFVPSSSPVLNPMIGHGIETEADEFPTIVPSHPSMSMDGPQPDATPKASHSFFDDNFGSSFPSSSTSPSTDITASASLSTEELDHDFFAIKRSGSTGDLVAASGEGANSSNRSNALAFLERSFGKVSLTTSTSEEQDAVEESLSEAMSENTTATTRSKAEVGS